MLGVQKKRSSKKTATKAIRKVRQPPKRLLLVSLLLEKQ
ncbi:hypothetical protein B602_0448 [Chlamydia psittaci M56]|nr:hypothetical protein B602_0448 [Chlamydia psittaci M56]